MNSGIIAIYRRWHRIRARLFTVVLRGAFLRVGRRTVLYPPLRVAGETRISIGADVYLGPNSWMQVLSPAESGTNPVISIGAGVAVTGFCTITAVRSVVIEDKVLMARYVYISDHIHAHDRRDVAILEQGITGIAPVRICEGAWLGQNVVVCPGVTIGRNAVIGANSVVRHDVPDFAVAAGVPARVIRMIDEVRRK